VNLRLISLCLLLTAASAHADSFIIDSSHTLPVFEVNHLGFSTQRGRFNETRGTLELDRKTHTGRVSLTIETQSIDMGIAKWDEHMKSKDFFNTQEFPTARFEADKFVFDGDTPVAAEGVLTLLGVSRPLHVRIDHFHCGENPIVKKSVCAADIETSLKRSEFGMTKYLPGVGDDVRILVPVEAFKVEPTTSSP
jgi:polyisoprenoid-binding protein YceI